MRITFVLPSADLSGGVRAVVVYAQRLKQRGHEVLVVYPPPRQPTLMEKAKSLVKRRGWPGRRVAGPSHLDNTDVPCHVLEHCRPVVDSDVPDADVVVATWWETAEWVAGLSESKGAKAYFIQHDESIWFPDDRQWVERVHATWRLPMHRITTVLWLADVVSRGCGENVTEIIPYGVDMEQFSSPPRGKQAVPTVALMYSTNRFKGVDISLEAFRLAKQRVTNLRMIAFSTCNVVEALPLASDTEFHLMPHQDVLPRLYAKCDAYLFGSRCEGFGMPIMEAMACRTPVIGTPTGIAPELCAHGGMLVDMESPASMADAIVRVAQMSEPQWRLLSDAAYAAVRDLTWDSAAAQFEAALTRAVERVGRAETVGVGGK